MGRLSVSFLIVIFPVALFAAGEGPPADCPVTIIPPAIVKADVPLLKKNLQRVDVNTNDPRVDWIFAGEPEKTKMEQFFQLMYMIQDQMKGRLPVEVGRADIVDILLASKVFTTRDFPDHIMSVILSTESVRPRYYVRFDQEEVRFPLNGGRGFVTWRHGKCQRAKDLVLHDGFNFKLKKYEGNLVVYDFVGAEVYGDFGARGILDVDVNFVEFGRVEFVAGTKRAKVTSRVAKREYTHNPNHNLLFRLIGRLIPDTTEHRIDW